MSTHATARVFQVKPKSGKQKAARTPAVGADLLRHVSVRGRGRGHPTQGPAHGAACAPHSTDRHLPLPLLGQPTGPPQRDQNDKSVPPASPGTSLHAALPSDRLSPAQHRAFWVSPFCRNTGPAFWPRAPGREEDHRSPRTAAPSWGTVVVTVCRNLHFFSGLTGSL